MSKFSSIQQQLEQLLSYDKKSWVRIYELMEQVEVEQLYLGKFHSYTAWVNFLAKRAHVNISLLWRRKKAGQIYREFELRQQDNGREVPHMQDVNVSPDNFVLINKIAGDNEEVVDDLLRKLLSGNLQRRDLNHAWNIAKSIRTDEGKKNAHVNGYDKEKISVSYKALYSSDIIQALSMHTEWLQRKEKDYIPDKYKIFTELPIRMDAGTSIRRMNAVIFENLSVEESEQLSVHGIEIKTTKEELSSAFSIRTFVPFCNYLWVAVPYALRKEMEKRKPENCGILCIDEKKNVFADTQAPYQSAPKREEMLSAGLLALI